MNYTAPQLRLLSEGELYNHYTRPGRGSDSTGTPIDQLINLVQSNFIDWDLSSPKFKMMFQQTHPHASEAYLEEMGGMAAVIDDELSDMTYHNQSNELVQVLIRKTKETEEKPASNILKGLISDVLELSVRAGHVLKDLNVLYLGELIATPKAELLKHSYIGRVTIKEFERVVARYFDEQERVDPDVLNTVVRWVNSDWPAKSGSWQWTPRVNQ